MDRSTAIGCRELERERADWSADSNSLAESMRENNKAGGQAIETILPSLLDLVQVWDSRQVYSKQYPIKLVYCKQESNCYNHTLMFRV